MGGGIALALRQRYPVIFPEYQQLCRAGQLKIGMIQLVPVSQVNNLYVCNLAGQDGLGGDRCYTDYDALRLAFARLQQDSDRLELPVYLPYGLGCGLAGGDWQIVSGIIDEHCPRAIAIRLNVNSLA